MTSVLRRVKDRQLLKQGIWTGGEGSIFAAAPARLQDLLLLNTPDRLQALAADSSAGSEATQSSNASDAELNATAPANASDATAINTTAANDTAANATAANATAANATAAAPQAGAWSYYGLTPLDLAEDWALGESNSSDRRRIDAPPMLHISPCRHDFSRRWWQECPAGRRRWRLCRELAAARPLETGGGNANTSAGAGGDGNTSISAGGDGAVNATVESKNGTDQNASDSGEGASGGGAGTGQAGLGCERRGRDDAEEGSPEWWGTGRPQTAWQRCAVAGFGSRYWNVQRCWLARCAHA